MKKIKWAVLALVIGYCLNGKTQAIAPFQIHDRVVVSTPTEVFPNIFGVLGGSVSSAAIGKNGTILSIAAFPSTDLLAAQIKASQQKILAILISKQPQEPPTHTLCMQGIPRGRFPKK